jgi:hypothetical protein
MCKDPLVVWCRSVGWALLVLVCELLHLLATNFLPVSVCNHDNVSFVQISEMLSLSNFEMTLMA